GDRERRGRDERGQRQRGDRPDARHCWRVVAGSPLEAAPSVLPSAVVTSLALARLLPSRARLPATVTTSPTFIGSRSHPRCCSWCGAPISQAHRAERPVSSLTRI